MSDIINEEGRCWLTCTDETKAKLKQAYDDGLEILVPSDLAEDWAPIGNLPRWLSSYVYQARRPAKPAPTHEEIMTSGKYWEVYAGRWCLVTGYDPDGDYSLDGDYRRNKNWFADVRSADCPPEVTE
jgi:hypothetical protein